MIGLSRILRHNRELLNSISEKILEKEVIEGDELKDLLASSLMPPDAALPYSSESSKEVATV
jgi:ATP-dependent Zn protease